LPWFFLPIKDELAVAASVGKLPILGENGDHVPAHYMMHVNGIISIVDSAPLFRLEELMTQK
jgi:hypothetical protein